jgi:hypothetical protein
VTIYAMPAGRPVVVVGNDWKGGDAIGRQRRRLSSELSAWYAEHMPDLDAETVDRTVNRLIADKTRGGGVATVALWEETLRGYAAL